MDGVAPSDLWQQAHDEHPDDADAANERYVALMREHRYLMMPGDAGYEDGVPIADALHHSKTV